MLNDLKLMLGFENDNSVDEKLKLIISTSTARLKVLLGGLEPPEDLFYIIREVSVIRFNKIGSEGMKSQSVEGESMTFDDNDFNGFMDEIQAFLDTQQDSARGKLRFL
jgi:hypothetical protein